MSEEGSFTLDAWIIGGRPQHDRETAHYGVDLATNVVLSEAISGYPARTRVQDVLESLASRIEAVESGNHHVVTFTLDATILGLGAGNVIDAGGGLHLGAFALDAIISGPVELDFTLDAEITAGGWFTLDAVIIAEQLSFTLDAWII